MAAAASAFAKPEDDSSLAVRFRSEDWLRSRPLAVETIMEYFRMSPWYDIESINERALSQGLSPEAARNLTGLEYRVLPQATQADGLIVLEAWRRFGPAESDAELVCLYYCLWGTMFQAPDLFSVLASRARRAAAHISHAMACVTAAATLEGVQMDPSSARKRQRATTANCPPSATTTTTGGASGQLSLRDHRRRKQFVLRPQPQTAEQRAVIDASIAASTETALGKVMAGRSEAVSGYRRAAAKLAAALEK